MTHLGETLDFHIGGRDLVFPHHENEIAQSEAATDQPFANYWLHCELFQMDDEKMSSSLGNFVTVEEACSRWGSNALRTFLTAGSYNSSQLYSDETIAEALERWDRLERAYESAVETLDSPAAMSKEVDEDLRETVETATEAFTEAMNDDFNTREAQSALLGIAGAMNRHTDDDRPYDYQGLRAAVETIEELGAILGLSFSGSTTGTVDLAGDVVDLVLDVREHERESGNYDRADELRAELEGLGVEVQDTDDGPTYRLPRD